MKIPHFEDLLMLHLYCWDIVLSKLVYELPTRNELRMLKSTFTNFKANFINVSQNFVNISLY